MFYRYQDVTGILGFYTYEVSNKLVTIGTKNKMKIQQTVYYNIVPQLKEK